MNWRAFKEDLKKFVAK